MGEHTNNHASDFAGHLEDFGADWSGPPLIEHAPGSWQQRRGAVDIGDDDSRGDRPRGDRPRDGAAPQGRGAVREPGEDPVVPDEIDERLAVRGLEAYRPEADDAVDHKIKVCMPDGPRRPPVPPETCASASVQFRIRYNDPPGRRLSAGDKSRGGIASEPFESLDNLLAVQVMGTRIGAGTEAVLQAVEDLTEVAAKGGTGRVREALEAFTRGYNAFVDEVAKLVHGGVLSIVEGTVECPFHVCAGDQAFYTLYVEHNESMSFVTKGDGWYAPKVTVRLGTGRERPRLTVLPVNESGQPSPVDLDCDGDDGPLPSLPVPRVALNGYTSPNEPVTRRFTRWDLIQVPAGSSSLVLTYDLRVGLDPFGDNTLIETSLQAYCAVFKLQRQAVEVLRKVYAGEDTVGDAALDLLAELGNTALSGLKSAIALGNKVAADNVGRIIVTDSSLVLRLLRTSDVELINEDIPGTVTPRTVLRAKQDDPQRSATFALRPDNTLLAGAAT